MAIVRPGIDPKWLNHWKRTNRHTEPLQQQYTQLDIPRLEEYIATGVPPRPDPEAYDPPPTEVIPPRTPWEDSLYMYLKRYGTLRLIDWERNTLKSDVWDSENAAASFAAFHTGLLIYFHIHALFPQRWGRSLQSSSHADIAYAALGLITGAPDQAFGLARCQIRAYREGWTFDRGAYPIFTFMLRLFADHLGQPPIPVEGDPAEEPIFNVLFDEWRTTDLAALTNLCLAGLDYHTSRSRADRRDMLYEFSNTDWTRCPIELLLLFKLRTLNGLDNPVIDHPLTQTALGVLPPETGFRPDDLVARVRARMEQDGFDEQSILAMADDDPTIHAFRRP